MRSKGLSPWLKKLFDSYSEVFRSTTDKEQSEHKKGELIDIADRRAEILQMLAVPGLLCNKSVPHFRSASWEWVLQRFIRKRNAEKVQYNRAVSQAENTCTKESI